jgi:hypothetical protein
MHKIVSVAERFLVAVRNDDATASEPKFEDVRSVVPAEDARPFENRPQMGAPKQAFSHIERFVADFDRAQGGRAGFNGEREEIRPPRALGPGHEQRRVLES